jgi:hypothetical protein
MLSAIALGMVILMPITASAQGVSIYIGPGYSGYGVYPPPYAGYSYGYPSYGYAYPGYGYAYPRYGYGYPGYGYSNRPYYGGYWGHGRRVARRVNRRWNRWD